jgi:hypothetical protein
MTGTCENCGSPDEAVSQVVRIYLIHDDDATPGSEPRVVETEGTELWCPACRANYPHRIID